MKSTIKVVIGTFLLVVPTSLITKAPSWAMYLSCVIVSLLLSISIQIDEALLKLKLSISSKALVEHEEGKNVR